MFCIDPNPPRLKLAEQLGAVPLLADYKPENSKLRVDAVRKVCSFSLAFVMFVFIVVVQVVPDGVDLAVEVAGSPSVLSEALRMLRFGGHFALAGMVTPNSKLDGITGEDLIRKCVTVRGTHNYAPEHLDQAVQFLSDFGHALPLDSFVSPPFPLEKLSDAVQEAIAQTFPRVSISF